MAYAQFEELESFARFGARMDDDTRRSIDYGQRIRSCLKQPEFAPVSAVGQIAVLVALTSRLFDSVPLDKMPDAEKAVREAAVDISEEIQDRLQSGEKLSDADREAIINLAQNAISRVTESGDHQTDDEPADSGATS